MVRSGLSAVIGSWKIIAMPAPRTSRISADDGRAEIAAFEHHAAAVDRHLVRQQPHDGVGHHRLAGAGFADHAEDFVRAIDERYVRQRMRPVGAARQAHAEMFEREDGGVLAHRLFSLGLSASFRPWPTSDTASTVTRIAMPGIAETYHCTRSTSRPRPIRLPQDATFGIGEPEKGQRAFEQDRDRHHDAGVDDHRRQGVGQDLAEDELDIPHAQRAAGLDEFAVAQRQEFGAGQPRRRRPRHDADRDGDGGQGRAEHGDQHQQQHEIRQRLERLGDAHQHIVDPAAIVAGEGADQDADQDGDRGGDAADQQRDPRAVENLRGDVAAGIVGAEQEARIRERPDQRPAGERQRIARIETSRR